MRASELSYALSNLDYVDRSNWDLTRLVCLISALKASRKKLKLRDICEFPWDHIEQSDEQIKQILESQKQMEDILNNKKV